MEQVCQGRERETVKRELDEMPLKDRLCDIEATWLETVV